MPERGEMASGCWCRQLRTQIAVPFLRAKDQRRKNKSAKKGMYSVLQVEVPMRQSSQDVGRQLGVLIWSAGGKLGLGMLIGMLSNY